MSRAARRRDREQLERELRSDEYQALLRLLREGEAQFSAFTTWDEVLRFMREEATEDQHKDAVLAALLRAHAADKDTRWKTVLLMIFWPGLEALHARRLKWDPDPAEFWQNIMSAFMEAVCRINVEHRSTRLAAWLINQTIHRLYEQYERIWERNEDEVVVDMDELDRKSTEKLGVDFAGLDARERQENDTARLQRHLRSGLLSKDDFRLLLESRVQGKPLQGCADELGLTYQVAKKRRLRAEAALRQFEATC